MEPLISWDSQEDLQGHDRCEQLEKNLKGQAVLFNSNQSAISACLELMGSRVGELFCVMPVTAPKDAVQGVIRAGAMPILLDISPADLQLATEPVVELLESVPNAVVYLTRPGGLPIRPELLEAVQEVPTIIDSRLPPVERTFLGTFNLYDLSGMIGQGSLLYHHDTEKVNELKIIRDMSNTHVPELLVGLFVRRWREIGKLKDTSQYTELLEISNESGIIGYKSVTPTYTFLAMVSDAGGALEALNTQGYKAELGLIPVYTYADMRKRWKEEPDYPVAESLKNKVLLLPNHPLNSAGEILEIINDQEKGTYEEEGCCCPEGEEAHGSTSGQEGGRGESPADTDT